MTLDPWQDLPLDPRLLPALEAARAGDLQRFEQCVAAGELGMMIYGRQLLQVLRQTPNESPWARWHAAPILEYGSWDRVDDEILAGPVGASLRQCRDVYLAPLSEQSIDLSGNAPMAYFDRLLAGDARRARQLAIRAVGVDATVPLLQPNRRHSRYMRLEETVLLAWEEMVAGRLELALGLVDRAKTLGVSEDHQRIAAADLRTFVLAALGTGDAHPKLLSPEMLSGPRGPGPAYTCAWLLEECLLSTLIEPQAVIERADAAHAIAARLGSPRLVAAAEAWGCAGKFIAGDRAGLAREIPAQLELRRHATPGLRALPLLIAGVINGRVDQLEESARLARASGQGWLALSALAWLTHSGSAGAARNLHRLLRVTGWRSLALVPRPIAAVVARRISDQGFRSLALIDFALATRDEGAISAVATAHLRDRDAPATYPAAAHALARLGRSEARAVLHEVAASTSPAAAAASAALAKRTDRLGLSQREVEVLRLAAAGHTNVEIARSLVISPHTVARHLENSRDKLGAANRAEAVALWLSLGARL